MNARIHNRWVLVTGLALALAASAPAAIQVSISGPGGSGQAVLPDAGGAFAVDIPLSRNAVNPLTITATDKHGNLRSAELAITQVSLDQIVVSQVTAERLSTEEVERLVADGTIQLDDPANYNVSEFAIILTIDGQPVPINVPLVFPKGEPDPVGYENVQMPPGGDGGGGRPPPPPPPEIIVFLQEFSPGGPGETTPPPIPGVIIIEGRIKSLKEFFSVRLLLLNTSGIFTLSNVLAELEFPDGGLSHVLPADGLASFGDILPGTPDQPGALEKEFIIRGDAIGEKTVRVNFGGTVTGPGIPVDDPIPFNGSAETTVEVKGPPQFQVQVQHPAAVTSGVPYELTVEVRNAGELPALYASLELDVSADAKLANCTVDPATGAPDCEYVDEPVVQSLGHIQPGERIRTTWTVLPNRSGIISSCVGVSDHNISLQVVVGAIGCVAGHYPPDSGAPAGIPAATVVPFNNAQGISIDSPVVAFFSELMAESSIWTGTNGTFNVVDAAQNIVPGQIRFETNLSSRLLAIWQVNDGVLNRLRPGEEYTVYLSQDIRDRDGNALFNEWVSTFRTTTMGVNDTEPPQLTLSIEPPVNPNYVIPGEVVEVNAYAVDQGSGIARVELRLKDLDGTNLLFTLVDQKSVFAGDRPPFLFALDSARFTLGHTIQLLATAYDGMGNARDATLALIVAPTADPPSIQLPADPAAPVLQGIYVTLKPVALTGGVHEVRYHLDGAVAPFKTVTLPPWQASLATLALAYGAHEIRAVAVDGLGQTGEDTYAFNLVTNPSLPVVSFPGSVNGEVHVIGSSFAVQPRVEDEVGVRSVQVYLASPVTNLVATNAGPVVIDTAALDLGPHHVIVLATNELGNANDPAHPDSMLEFQVVPPPVGVPPAPPVVTFLGAPDGGYATVTGTSSNHARIDIENLDLGGVASVVADGSGAFNAGIAAAGGDRLQLVAYDLVHCLDPSTPTNVIVPAPPVLVGIGLTPLNFTLTTAGEHRDLHVTGLYDPFATNDITAQTAFSSSDPSVASVGATGRVVAVGRGTAFITATVGSFSQTSTVFVDIVSLTNLLVTPEEVNLISVGQTQLLSVTGQYNNGTSAALPTGNSFVSGDPAIATVSPGGTVTAAGDGLTQVTVYRAGVPSVAVAVRVDTGADPVPTVDLLQPVPGASVEPGGLVTVSVRARDATAGVVRVFLSVTGAAEFAETRQLSPAAKDTTQIFNIPVPGGAPVGGTLYVRTWASDTSGKFSATGTVAVAVVDASAPQVEILQPAPQTGFGYGDTLTVAVHVADASGVTQVVCRVAGAFALSQSRALSPPAANSNVVFRFTVPFGVPYPDAILKAEAWDLQGYRGQALNVPIVITDADLTPPATRVTAVSNPGAGTTATVTYEVTDGLDDLEQVAIYFRRDGHGIFNRYTDAAGGNPLGHYIPQSGAFGTLTFDSTKMGGDGTYEFYSIGTDQTGNRELAPTNGAGDVVADQTRAFAAGTMWVTLGTGTSIEAGNTACDNVNLRINAATVTVAGAHAFHNVELLNGAVLTHPETTGTEESGLDIAAWTLTVDSNSAVNVDGRGYLGGERPGNAGTNEGRTLGNVPGSTIRAGGSHGGSGGATSGGIPNALYGDLKAPSDPGSGGGRGGDDNWPGGDGGGRIRIQTVNIVNDGLISANGQTPPGSHAGSGSGGSVYLTVSTMSGRGLATANGGGFEVGGGGGRLALHHVDISTLDTSRLRALGGIGSVSSGGNGTVFIRSVAETGGTLIVDGQGAGSSFSALPIPPGYVFDNVIIRNSARVVADDPIVVSNELQILTGSIVTHTAGQEAGVRIEARTLVVDATSSIDVTGKGYPGGERPGNINTNEGRTLGGQIGAAIRAGGAYGGIGGSYGGAQPNPVHGDPRNPVALGSGGGRGGDDNWPGGNGGGRITILATDTVALAGAIRADGAMPPGSLAGSGSGGSVKIDTSLLRGSGVIAANGGAFEVGGSGGRVAIAYDYLGQAGDDLDGLRNITAFGGHGNSAWGGAGTVVLRRHDQPYGDLYVDDNQAGATSGAWTPLPHIGFGTVQALTADTLQTDGKVVLLPGGLVGLEINPNATQTHTFTIVANTSTTLTVDASGGLALTNVAAVGNAYAGVHRFDNIFFRRGGFLVTGDKVVVGDAVRIDEYGRWTHFDATAVIESRLDLEAGTLAVSSNASIDADGRGYLGGERPGNEGTNEGRTEGNTAGSSIRAGGSYGGLGGATDGGTPAASHGSLTQPAALGSGGGRGGDDNWPGGDGGGWIRILAGEIQVDGVLSANGATPSGSLAGSGSGGTIDIETGALSGNGFLRANGGGFEVGGGGGRVAVRYGSLALATSHLEAKGGAATTLSGGNGTVFLKQASQANGDLIIDGHGTATPADLCFIPGGYMFDNVTLRNQAYVTANNGLTVRGGLWLANTSTLTHSLEHEAGLALVTSNLEIDATSTIDVSGRGYRGGRRDGNPDVSGLTLAGQAGAGVRVGGSHGGLGANAPLDSVYGSPLRATHLGGGGGRGGDNNWPGGNGGGRVVIAATNITVAGAIRANGGVPNGSLAGSGAGGSIQIATATLQGGGFIEANGGAFETGGGGGRIAVSCATFGGAAGDFNSRRNLTAFGGHGSSGWGSAGTVVLKQGAQACGDLYVDDNTAAATTAQWTPLTRVAFGRATAVTTDTLTTDGRVAYLPGALVGLWLAPNTAQTQAFEIVANTASNIVVDLPAGQALTNVAAAGDEYAASYSFDNVYFRRGGFLVCGDLLHVGGMLDLAEFGCLTHFDAGGSYESRLELECGKLRLATNGFINLNGRGYPGGERPGNAGVNEGRTLDNQIGAAVRAGGSHGGLGGNTGDAMTPVYGSLFRPAALGSGGGRGGDDNWPGGDGGGRAHIVAATAVVDGVISADGAAAVGSLAGCGSGGSVWIEAGHIEGAGTIQANGGAFEVGGGGGRVAVHYDSFGGSAGDFDGRRRITAWGGSAAAPGGAGTVLLKQTAQESGDLYVDGGETSGPASRWTPLPHIGFGVVQDAAANVLHLDGTVSLLPGGLAGNLFLPDRGSNRFVEIIANTATTLTMAAGVDLGALTAPGRNYAGLNRFDNVYFRRGGFLASGDRLAVAGVVRIEEHGRLTHPDATTAYESALDLLAGELLVAADGAVDAGGRGYLGGERPGNAGTNEGRTEDNASGSTIRAGGSHGGLGGFTAGHTPNPVYGSASEPVDLGSGGGRGGDDNWPGGDGGGRIAILAGRVQVDGVIAADGATGAGSNAGSGSGGSVYLRTGELSGLGTIRANGGGGEVAGGGGRVAVYFTGAGSTTNALTITATANSAAYAGQAGSVFVDGTYVYVPFSFSGTGGGSGPSPFSLYITSLIRQPPGGAKVGWSEKGPRRALPAAYVVEFAPDLLSRTNWIPLAGQLSDGQWEGTLPADAPRGFIRIRRAP